MPPGRKRIYPLGTTLAQKILIDLKKRSGKAPCSEVRLTEILRSSYRLSPGSPPCPLQDVSISEIAPPKRAARALKNMKIMTVGQLLAAPIEALMSQWSFGKLSISAMQASLYQLLFPTKRSRDASPVSYSSFQEMVTSFIGSVIQKDRTTVVLIERLGLEGRRTTLAALGARFGITRERVRQIEAGGLEILASPPNRRKLHRFWDEVWAILKTWVKPYPADRLAESIRKRFGWKEAPNVKPLCRILKLHPNIAIDGDGNVAMKR